MAAFRVTLPASTVEAFAAGALRDPSMGEGVAKEIQQVVDGARDRDGFFTSVFGAPIGLQDGIYGLIGGSLVYLAALDAVQNRVEWLANSLGTIVMVSAGVVAGILVGRAIERTIFGRYVGVGRWAYLNDSAERSARNKDGLERVRETVEELSSSKAAEAA
jgi:hypothetical protein